MATLVAAALVWTAPGLGVYEAVAAVGVAPVKVVAPVGGGVAGAGAAAGLATGLNLTGNPFASPNAVSLGAALTNVLNPQLVNPAVGMDLPATVLPNAGQSAYRAGLNGTPIPAAEMPAPAGRIPQSIPPGGGPPLQTAPANHFNPGKTRDFIKPAPDSLQMIRSQPNQIGLRLRELRAAFKTRGISNDYEGHASRTAGLKGRAVKAPDRTPTVSGTVSYLSRVPGLKAFVKDAAAGSPSFIASVPTPLILEGRRGAVDMRVAVVERAGLLKHARGENGGFYRPEDFAAEAAHVAAERVQTEAGKSSDQPGGKWNWFGLGKVAMMLIASLLVAQIGIESLGAAMPSLIQKTFGDFTAVAQLAIVASIASVIGRQIGPLVVKRFGLKKTYLGADAVRLVSVSLLAGLLATGNMTLLMMGIFYAVNGVLGGISLTALESIPPAIVGRDAAKLEKFWTWNQTILEMAAIVTPILTGSVVASMGFLPALIAFPIAMAASLAIIFFTLRIPKRLEMLRQMEEKHKEFEEGAQRNFFGRLAYGAKLVWRNKPLRYSFLAFTFFVLINPMLYNMLAPAFALRLMATPELAASVQGWLTGLYSMGGLFGGFILLWDQWRGKRKMKAMREAAEAERGKMTDEAWEKEIVPWRSEKLRKSMLTWLLLGTVGLSMLVPLAFPLSTLGQAVALPAFLSWASGLTLQAGALILFGIAQVISVLKLRSFFQSRVPNSDENGVEVDNMPDAMGFFGSASMLVSTLGLLALKFLFQNVAGFAPFVYLAWGMIPLGALYLYLRWRLAQSSRPQN